MLYIRKMSKKLLFLYMFLIILMCLGCTNGTIKSEPQKVFSISALHNGDAKFMKESVITSVDGKLTIYDMAGNKIKKYDDINSNWIDSIDDEGIIVYGNFNNEIGIAKIDSEYNLISNEIVMTSFNLQIDPTIMKVDNAYFMTVTEIEGTVNNADSNIENGTYTIHLFKSDDLHSWTLLSDVISCKNNLEDVDVFYKNEKFYIVYEKEELDKGNSAICLITSEDSKGISWGKSKELLPADCDHEPAAIISNGEKYRLYYSCDKDNLGKSYMGGKIYYAEYNEQFNVLCKDEEITTNINGGILLYDVKQKKNETLFLTAEDYLSDCNMVVVRIQDGR